VTRQEEVAMAKETTCTICSANIPLEEDDRVGDSVFCSFCGTRLRIIKIKVISDKNVEAEVEEDWEG
jgi:DNA-directed RNA polymerase subunit RPC12/RpoP